jgi:hypothetical protein
MTWQSHSFTNVLDCIPAYRLITISSHRDMYTVMGKYGGLNVYCGTGNAHIISYDDNEIWLWTTNGSPRPTGSSSWYQVLSGRNVLVITPSTRTSNKSSCYITPCDTRCYRMEQFDLIAPFYGDVADLERNQREVPTMIETTPLLNQ